MLPFRVSPTSKHTKLFSQRPRCIPIPQTITPDSSDSDISPVSEPNRCFFGSPRNQSHKTTTISWQSNYAATTEADTDLDMTDSSSTPTTLSQPSQPQYQAVLPSRALQTTAVGRIPTPIYNHFPAAVGSDVHMSIEEDDHAAPFQASRVSERNLTLLRRHRLPSPISEDEDMVSPTSGTGGMLGRLNVERAADSSWAVGHGPDAHSGYEARGWWNRHGFRPDVGAERERESAKWGKTVLSMGYRADCDKCRTHLPGHWSHLIRV